MRNDIKSKPSGHVVALEDEQLTMEKIREMVQAHQGSERDIKPDQEPLEHTVALEDEELLIEEEMTMEKIRAMAQEHQEPGQKQASEHAAALDDEELTMDMIRAQAQAHTEPDVADLAAGFRAKLHVILFELRTPLGKAVNYSILVLIVAVVFASMLGTVPEIAAVWSAEIAMFEMAVLYVFLFEYLLRIYAAKHRWDYIRSFNGVVDLLTVVPLLAGAQGSVAIRLLRLLRLIKITTFFPALKALLVSVSGALNLLFAVLGTIALVSLFVGNMIYVIEPETFGNAFQGLWWSLVTMSTVGYGDFVPHTTMGKLLAGLLILTGILMFAMVTAVISVRVGRMVHMNARCLSCDKQISPEYEYCPFCGDNQADDIDLFGDDD